MFIIGLAAREKDPTFEELAGILMQEEERRKNLNQKAQSYDIALMVKGKAPFKGNPWERNTRSKPSYGKPPYAKPQQDDSNAWYVDSGGSIHISCNKDWFEN